MKKFALTFLVFTFAASCYAADPWHMRYQHKYYSNHWAPPKPNTHNYRGYDYYYPNRPYLGIQILNEKNTIREKETFKYNYNSQSSRPAPKTSGTYRYNHYYNRFPNRYEYLQSLKNKK